MSDSKIEGTGWYWSSEWQRHEAEASVFRDELEPWIVKHFGPRPAEDDPECDLCKRWRALDELLRNTFEKPEEGR